MGPLRAACGRSSARRASGVEAERSLSLEKIPGVALRALVLSSRRLHRGAAVRPGVYAPPRCGSEPFRLAPPAPRRSGSSIAGSNLLQDFRSRSAKLCSSHAGLRSRRRLRSAGKASASRPRFAQHLPTALSRGSRINHLVHLSSSTLEQLYKIRRIQGPTVGIGTTKRKTKLVYTAPYAQVSPSSPGMLQSDPGVVSERNAPVRC